MVAESMAHSGQSSDMEVFLRSLVLVGVAELFDKTWFMGLLLALRYRAITVFVGSFAALFVHVILAAAMGYAFARFLSPAVLSYLTAAVMLCFTCLYAKDWYYADPESDAIEAGKEDAAGDCQLLPQDEVEAEKEEAKPAADDLEALQVGLKAVLQGDELVVLAKCFMGVFIAEWGDRTQIAMIGQHASQPLVPVFLGSTVAFFMLTLSAVGAASLLHNHKIREKTIMGISACFFAVFFALSLRDALTASAVASENAS